MMRGGLVAVVLLAGCQAAAPERAEVAEVPAVAPRSEWEPEARPSVTPPPLEEQAIVSWLAAHPEVVALEASTLGDGHWMTAVSTAARTTRCVLGSTADYEMHTCWSARTSEIRATRLTAEKNHLDIKLLERYTRDGGQVAARWLRFRPDLWSPAELGDAPADEQGPVRPRWYMTVDPGHVAAEPPIPRARWRNLVGIEASTVELQGAPSMKEWDIARVPTRTPGLSVIELRRRRYRDNSSLVCARWRERWRCSAVRRHGGDEVDHEVAYMTSGREGELLAVQVRAEHGGEGARPGLAGSTRLELFAGDGVAWTPVSSLLIGAMRGEVLRREESDESSARRLQIYFHTHAPRGGCIELHAPEYEHVEIAGYYYKKGDLEPGKFSRWPVADRLEAVEGELQLPRAGEVPADGSMPSWTLTGLWRLGVGGELLRVDDAAECEPVTP